MRVTMNLLMKKVALKILITIKRVLVIRNLETKEQSLLLTLKERNRNNKTNRKRKINRKTNFLQLNRIRDKNRVSQFTYKKIFANFS